MIRNFLVNFVSKNLLHAVTPHEVISQDKDGNIFVGGKALSSSEVSSLHQEAEAIRHTRLWSLMTNTVRDLAEKKMFKNSVSWNDMAYGKSLLWVISLQESIIKCLDVHKERERIRKSDTLLEKDINNS